MILFQREPELAVKLRSHRALWLRATIQYNLNAGGATKAHRSSPIDSKGYAGVIILIDFLHWTVIVMHGSVTFVFRRGDLIDIVFILLCHEYTAFSSS